MPLSRPLRHAIACLVAYSACDAAHAAQWSAQPSIWWYLDYDTNRTLSPAGQGVAPDYAGYMTLDLLLRRLSDTGELSIRTEGGLTHVMYGPWQVVIRGLGARAERKVLAVWETYRSWVGHSGVASHVVTRGMLTPGGSEQVALGASELRWRVASELRLGGASEVFRLGASELRYLGASETLYSGASEWRLRGASELRFLGASRWLYGGASEQRSGGASEWLFPGASERAHLGASERHRERSLGYPEDEQMTGAESLPRQR